MISETMIKHNRHCGVFLWSGDKQPTKARWLWSRHTRHIWLGLVSLSLRNSFCPLVYKFHSTPIKSLSKWWQARGGHRSRPHPPGNGNICLKTMSAVKIFTSGSKWRISGTGRCRLGSLTAEQHSETSHWFGLVKEKSPCHLEPPTRFFFFTLPEQLFFFGPEIWTFYLMYPPLNEVSSLAGGLWLAVGQTVCLLQSYLVCESNEIC